MSDGPTVSDKIFKNTLFNTVGNLWKMLIALAITPYIIGHVGIDRYGVWALVSIVAGYFGLLDLGIGASFVKYISEFYTQRRFEKIDRLVSTGIVFYSAFALFITTLAYFTLDPILNLLHVSQALHAEAFFVLFLGVALFGLTNVMSAFSAIQGGLQRMDITNKITVLVSIPMVIGTVFFLESGYGLIGLMINNLLIFLITSVFNFAAAFKLMPMLRVRLSLFRLDMLKKLFRFGYKVQIGNIGDTVVFQTDKIIIAYFLNMGLVGYYQLGSQISQTIRSLPILMISALLPAASEIHALNDRKKLQDLYLKGSKYIMFVSFPLTFFTIAAANTIMLIWMGPGYEQAVWVVQILAIGYLFNLICGVAVTIGAAIDKPELQMNASMITIVSNLALSILLINAVGYIGVAMATTISLLLGPVYYFIKFHQEIKLSFKKLIKDVALVPMAASIIPALSVYAIYHGLTWAQAPSGRVVNFLILGIMGLIFAVIYLLAIWYHRYFDQFDRDLMERYFPAGRMMSLLHTYVRSR